jgi:hypothetical protein
MSLTRPVIRSRLGGRCSDHTGCFNAVVSIGSLRRRLPVAAKIALVTNPRKMDGPAIIRTPLDAAW